MTRPILTARLSSVDLLRVAASFGLTARELSKAAANAVNDTAKTGRGRTRKRVRKYVTLPAARVNKAIQVEKRATPDSLSATITLDKTGGKGRSANRATLMSFRGRPSKPHTASTTPTGRKRKKKPFSYQILRQGARRILPGGFVQIGQDFAKGNIQGSSRERGGPRAFVREGKKRYPLHVPLGPSVAAIWQEHENGVATDVMSDLNEILPSRLQGQARRIYDRKWKKVAA